MLDAADFRAPAVVDAVGAGDAEVALAARGEGRGGEDHEGGADVHGFGVGGRAAIVVDGRERHVKKARARVLVGGGGSRTGRRPIAKIPVQHELRRARVVEGEDRVFGNVGEGGHREAGRRDGEDLHTTGEGDVVRAALGRRDSEVRDVGSDLVDDEVAGGQRALVNAGDVQGRRGGVRARVVEAEAERVAAECRVDREPGDRGFVDREVVGRGGAATPSVCRRQGQGVRADAFRGQASGFVGLDDRSARPVPFMADRADRVVRDPDADREGAAFLRVKREGGEGGGEDGDLA